MIYRVPVNYPGAGRRVYPGFLQHTGFVAMNPDRHLKLALRLLPRPGPRRRRRAPSRTASSTTSTTPCSTCRPSTTSTRSRPCSRTSRSSTAPGTSTASWCGRRTSRTTALLTIEGELDDISGAGQTSAAHELCTGIPTDRQFHYDVDRRRPLRHLLGPPLAREGLSRRCATSSPRYQTPADGAAKPARKPRRAKRREAVTAPERSPMVPATVGRLADALDDALPQTQCTRCGYPDCRGYAAGDRRRRRRHQPLPARRRRRHRAPGRASPAGRSQPLDPDMRHRRAARAGA